MAKAITASGGNAPSVSRQTCDLAEALLDQFPDEVVLGLMYGGRKLEDVDPSSLQVLNKSQLYEALGVIEIIPGTPQFEKWYNAPGSFLGSNNKGRKVLPVHKANFSGNAHLLGLTGLVTIGGDGSLKHYAEVADGLEIAILGNPKTIDNDLQGVSPTPGADSASRMVAQDCYHLKHHAGQHQMVMIVEAMGRDEPWHALKAAVEAGDIDGRPVVDICLGSESYDYKEFLLDLRKALQKKPAPKDVYQYDSYALVLISEGIKDVHGKLLSHTETADRAHKIRGGDASNYLREILLSPQSPIEGLQSLHDEVCALIGDVRTSVTGHRARVASISAYDAELSVKLAEVTARAMKDGITHHFVANKADNSIVLHPIPEMLAMEHRFDPENVLRKQALKMGISLGCDITQLSYVEHWHGRHRRSYTGIPAALLPAVA